MYMENAFLNDTSALQAMTQVQEALLEAESFLNENYRFRHNLLSGKTEFMRLPDATAWEVLTEMAVNSIILHGNECVPVLMGEQGCGKSTFAVRLLPEPLRIYFLDHINLGNKFDSEMALTHNLLVNIDEFANMGPSQQGRLKQMLSKVKVNGRPIFGKAQEDRPRFASFLATTNEAQPLCDETGSRRYLCIKIPKGQLIDNESPIDYTQLFAQLKHELQVDQVPYWFSNAEVARIQRANLPYQRSESSLE